MAKKRIRGTDDEETWCFNIGWANDFEVVIILTSDINKSRKARDSIFGVPYESEYEPCGLFCGKGLNGYIFLAHKFDPDTVTHEVYHLVDYVMGRLGVKERDSEVMAYHMGWIVGKISELYLKVKEKNDKKALTTKKGKRKVASRGKKRPVSV